MHIPHILRPPVLQHMSHTVFIGILHLQCLQTRTLCLDAQRAPQLLPGLRGGERGIVAAELVQGECPCTLRVSRVECRCQECLRL